MFRRQPTTISVAAPPYQEDILSDVLAGETSILDTAAGSVNTTDATGVPPALRTTHSSNNVLNPNLSGSFKDDEEDDALLQCIYEPAAPTVISNFINPSQTQQIAEGGDNNQQPIVTADSDSIFIQTPTQGGIAVAALPRDSNETTHIPPATTNTARFW